MIELTNFERKILALSLEGASEKAAILRAQLTGVESGDEDPDWRRVVAAPGGCA